MAALSDDPTGRGVDLPSGFTLDTPGGGAAPLPPPELPPGFVLDGPEGRPTSATTPSQPAASGLPAGFQLDNLPDQKGSQEQVKQQPTAKLDTTKDMYEDDAEGTDQETPGFIGTVAGAFGKKAAEAAASLATGTQVLLPEGMGGTSLEKQYQDGVVHPKTKDAIDKLLDTPLTRGWTDWQWWAAQMAGNLGGVTPGLGTALAGSAVGGPLAGIAGFAGEAAIERLAPAYNAARAKGLDPDAAMHQALVDSGIASAFAIGMGVVGKAQITRMLGLNPLIAQEINGEVADVLKRPALEALVQMGIVQPGLMAGQDITTTLANGESPNAEQVLTDMLIGSLAGFGIHETWKGVDRIQEMRAKAGAEPFAAAMEETIARAAEAQRPKGALEKLAKGTEPAAPVGPPGEGEEPEGEYERELARSFTSETPSYFFSQLANVIHDQMPESMPAQDVIPWLKKRGVKDAEINDTIKPFLADTSGKVSKRDLLADWEANRVQMMERVYKYTGEDPMQEANELYDHYRQVFGTPNMGRWSPRAQREVTQARDRGQLALQEARRNAPQYPGQLFPSLRTDPEEITFQVGMPNYHPEDVERRAMSIYETEAWGTPREQADKLYRNLSDEDKKTYRDRAVAQLHKENPDVYKSPHYKEDLNNVGHARISWERDRDGHLTMVVHEQQSDVHQEAAKLVDPEQRELGRVGYKTKGLTTDIAQSRVNDIEQAINRELRKLQRQGMNKDQIEEDPKIMKLRGDLQGAIDDYHKAVGEKQKPPELPFKSNIHDLMAKRLMQLAADRGATRMVLLNGDQVGLRLGHPDIKEARGQLNGAREFYDKKLPGIWKHWGKQYGAETGYTRFEGTPEDPYEAYPIHAQEQMRTMHEAMGLDPKRLHGDMLFMSIDPHVASAIRKGMPFYDQEISPRPGAGQRTLSDIVQENKYPERMVRAAGKIESIMLRLGNEFKISRGITFNALPMDTDWRGRVRPGFDPATGNYIVDLNTKRILTEHDLYAAAGHEFGHIIYHNVFKNATDNVKAPILAAYQAELKKRAAVGGPDPLVSQVRRLRDNAISLMTGARSMHDKLRVSDLTPRSKDYFLGFKEWFAEQVAKYLQTDAKPLGVVDGFFKRLANKVRKMLAEFWRAEGPTAGRPEKAIQEFLDNRWGMPADWLEPIKEQFERDTTIRNQQAMDKEGAPQTPAVPMTASTVGGRNIIAALPPELKANGEGMAAHGDRMNAFYDLMLSLPQVAELNKHNMRLGTYNEMHRVASRQMNELMQAAHSRVMQWGAIRDPKQQTALTKAIDAYANGLFKKDVEDGIFRRPNANEFKNWVKQWGLSDQSVRLFQGITQDFDDFLEKYRTLLINDAMKIKDQGRRTNNIANINSRIDGILQRPFIPLSRFGKYLITVYDQKGNIRHSEQTNSLRRQRQIVEALEKSPDRLPGDQVLPGMVPKDATPFLGMPPGLLDLVADKLSLSDTQRGVLDQLRFDYAPGQSFKHQFREADLVPGYSTDFMRNYAHFFFHGARHLTRITWVDAMRDQINGLASDVERRARVGQRDGAVKLDKVVKFMQKHFDAWVNPKSDWATLRGLMFHWYLGFNPASAVVNLTQSPLMTYPYLAAQYGDFATAKAMAKASLNLNTFYKKGSLIDQGKAAKGTGQDDAFSRGIAHAVTQGILTETQAHQLAAISEDRNLLRNFGKAGEASWLKFQEASSWMFEMTEQYNRRLAFRAGWDLGYNNPTSKEVQQAIRFAPIQYADLTRSEMQGGKGWTPQEAGAYLAAERAVNATQFEYGQYARPRIMRGPIGGTALVFKLFAQNTLFNLVSNPQMLWRWTLIMGALGGLQGLLGFENVNSMLKTIAYRAFGKDFDLEDEARQFAHDVISEKYGPDLLMHGLSAQGFGIPAVMHSIGIRGFPTVDLSKSVGFGDVLGFDPFRPLGPTKNPKEEELRQLTRASGAAFGLPLSIYDFATSNQNFTDLKKYESIAPRFLGNLSHAYRWWSQGKETNAAGNAVVKFNPGDTEQMMEILARVAGFQPRRLTEEWSRIAAKADAANFWDLRKAGLQRQFGEAVKSGDQESKDRVLEAVRKYNRDLPEWARTKAITSKSLQSSIQQRLKVQARQEAGLPASPSNIPISREVDKYYPHGFSKDQIGAKPVQ
jgi:hypothetical protein